MEEMDRSTPGMAPPAAFAILWSSFRVIKILQSLQSCRIAIKGPRLQSDLTFTAFTHKVVCFSSTVSRVQMKITRSNRLKLGPLLITISFVEPDAHQPSRCNHLFSGVIFLVFFPEWVARVPVLLWGSGRWGCVRSTLRSRSQPFATVCNRPQPSATVRAIAIWPCLWWVLQRWSFLEVSNVSLLRFA